MVNGQGKGPNRRDQVCFREMNANEPLMKCRNRVSCRAKSHYAEGVETSITDTWLLVMRPPAYRRHDLKAGFITEHGISVPGYYQGLPDTGAEVGLGHSSKETL